MEGARYLERNEHRLAWVMGSSRSGSTWLLRMLSAGRDVVGVDDPHLGHHLGVWRPLSLAWATAAEPPDLAVLPDVKGAKDGYFFCERYREAWEPALRELIRARFGAQLESELGGPPGPESVCVVKEPGSQSAGMLLSMFPRSHLVFLLRDGRDVVDSWLAAYQRGSWAIDEGAFSVAAQGRLALAKWLASVWAHRTRTVAEAFDAHDPDRRILVRYEELRARPAREVARVCAALGIDADPERVEAVVRTHDFDGLAERKRGSLREARSATPGAWRRNLDADEQRAIREIMAPELARWGYLRGVSAAA